MCYCPLTGYKIPRLNAAMFLGIGIVLGTVNVPVEASVSRAAVALLRGAEATRNSHATVRARFVLEDSGPGMQRRLNCLVEMDEGNRRFEIFADGNVKGEVVLITGDEFHGFRRKKNEDVQLYGARRSVGVRGDMAFDPRILGLSDLMPANASVGKSLWYENVEELELVGQEILRGVTVHRVKATKNNSRVTEYWIEEPTFRVHRVITRWPGGRSEIDSKFGSENPTSPFPLEVSVDRTAKSGNLRRRISVSEFDTGASLSPERFTLRGMEIPVGTPVIDVRIMRRIGFWNGEALQEKPVSTGRHLVMDKGDAAQFRRNLLIAVNVVIVITLVVFIWLRRRSTTV